MSSAIVEYLDKLDNQWKEIDRLSELAKANEHETLLYNSLCRAATILCVSHLEGFYKDTVRYYLSDFNEINFSSLPDPLKRSFCKSFIGHDPTKENNEKIRVLMSEFESHGKFKLQEKHFLPEKNKNPIPSVLEAICSSLGTNKIFSTIDGTIFDSVFAMNPKQIERSVNILNKKVKKRVSNFPCYVDKYIFNKLPVKPEQEEEKEETVNDKDKKKKEGKGRTLWQEFLDDLNKRRHDIAHGNNFENNTSPELIITAKNKCRILQLICILIIAANANQPPEQIPKVS